MSQHWNRLLELPGNPYDLFLGVLVARNEICSFKVTHIDLISKDVGEYQLSNVLLALVRGQLWVYR